ncbi:MAG: hypothetical protein R6V58_05775 [Planctomycetota bacterium]
MSCPVCGALVLAVVILFSAAPSILSGLSACAEALLGDGKTRDRFGRFLLRSSGLL